MPSPDERLAHHFDAQIKARLGEWAYSLTLQAARIQVLEEENQHLRAEHETPAPLTVVEPAA